VSPAFVWADATCSPLTSTSPTPSSSSRAASVTCTTTSRMQAMASRWVAAVESLKVVIAMIAKPFSLNKHSKQNTCKRNTGWMERRGGRERQWDCEKLWGDCENSCVYIDTRGAHLHQIVTVHPHTHTHFTLSKGDTSRPVLGGSHFSANRPVPVLTLFYENLIAFRIYIYIWACENRRGSQDFYFFQTQPRLKYGDSGRYTNNRFKQSGFHSFCKLLFPYYLLFKP